MLRNCCCCTLKTGVIVTGTLHLIGVVIYIIRYLYAISTGREYYGPDGLIGMLIWNTILIAAISFMIYGATKELRSFLLPWLIVQCVSLSYMTIIVLILAVIIHVIFLLFLLGSALAWYLWVVVYSYWKFLGEEEMRTQNVIPLVASSISAPPGQVAIHVEQCQPLYPNPDPTKSNDPPPYPAQHYATQHYPTQQYPTQQYPTQQYPTQNVYNPNQSYPTKN